MEVSSFQESGGFITGIRRELEEEEIIDKVTNIQERRLKIGKETWRVLTIYNRNM